MMKFSEAMLLGLPEIEFSNWYTFQSFEGKCKGCLVGAAFFASGVSESATGRKIAEFWPKLATAKLLPASCSCCGSNIEQDPLHLEIWSLCTHYANHYQREEISAEAIADIIRQIEPEEDEHAENGRETDATLERAVVHRLQEVAR